MKEDSIRLRAEFSTIVKDAMLYDFKPKEIPVCEKLLWRKYRNLVWRITDKQNLKKMPNFEQRAFRGYHLDHKVSIWYGYKNKLDPKLIGDINNLEFIPHQINTRKSTRSNFKDSKCLQSVIFV